MRGGRSLVTTRRRRLLQHRDGGCAFPGCTDRRFVDAQHDHPRTLRRRPRYSLDLDVTALAGAQAS